MRFVLLLTLFCLSCTTPAEVVVDRPTLDAVHVQQFFDAAFSLQQQEHKIVGAVISVVYQGEVLFKGGYGFADLEARKHADPDDSLFRIASISKPFVWTAIMQLAEQGRLSLDDPVDQYLDFELPATYEEPIRIWHLLTHTPGFEEMGTGSTTREAEDLKPLGEYLAARMPARVRPPGQQASYSNYGTDIAGFIIEKVTGQSWSDYVEQHVLGPLNMNSTNTQIIMEERLKARHAKGYKFEGGNYVASNYEYFGGLPAGHISTTADDMTRFMLAYLNDGALGEGRILTPETARQMQEPLFAPHNKISPMLHGFYRADRQGLKIYGHGGDVNQFHSNLSLYPDLDLGVFISFNSDPGSAARSRLIAGFVDHFFGGDFLPAPPEAANVDLEPYAGTYLSLRRNHSTFEKLTMLVAGVEVSASDSELVVSGGSITRWIALGDDVFRDKYADRYLVFTRDDDGQISHMIINGALGTMDRARGVDSPGFVQILLGIVFVISVLVVVAYTKPTARDVNHSLPRLHVALAWLFCLLVLGLYGHLGASLAGDPGDFTYGVPTPAHISLILMALNALLGVAVLVFALRHWINAEGALIQRTFYSLAGLAALLNLWIAYYFNILIYPFS
ncbi:MAG: serine hydrolase domain-containing protein [Pseudomonadota bacterium]